MSYYQHTISYLPVVIVIGLLSASVFYLFQLADWTVPHTAWSFMLACVTLPLCVACIINWIRVFVEAKGKRRMYNNRIDYIHFVTRITGLLFVLSVALDNWSNLLEQKSALYVYSLVVAIPALIAYNVVTFIRNYKKRRVAKV